MKFLKYFHLTMTVLFFTSALIEIAVFHLVHDLVLLLFSIMSIQMATFCYQQYQHYKGDSK